MSEAEGCTISPLIQLARVGSVKRTILPRARPIKGLQSMLRLRLIKYS